MRDRYKLLVKANNLKARSENNIKPKQLWNLIMTSWDIVITYYIMSLIMIMSCSLKVCCKFFWVSKYIDTTILDLIKEKIVSTRTDVVKQKNW